MRNLTTYLLLAFVAMLSLAGIVFAQDVIVPVPTTDFLQSLLSSIGGLKGASALAIAGVVSKLLLMFMGTDLFNQWFKNLDGGVKLVIALALSFISGLIALRMSGIDWGAALIHSSTLSAFVVLSNQVYKQWFEKKIATK